MRLKPNKKYVEYIGAKPLCTVCKVHNGIIRLIYLNDRLEASKNVTITCDKCFSVIHAGSE